MMVVPWLIYWCLTLVKYQRISWSLVPIMVALVWAHNTAGLISVIMLAVTGAVFLSFYGLRGMRRIALKAVLAVGATVAVLTPGLVAEVKMGGYYDPATTIIHENSLIRSFSFAHPWAFVFNPGYHWLAKGTSKVVPFGLDVQLDFAVTLLLVLGLFALAYLALRKVVSGSSTEVPRVDPALVSVLVVSLALYLVLQFRISLPLWDAFWQLKVVGYPFRMMTFAVPLALILAMVVSDWYLRLYRTRRPVASRWIPGALAVAWLASLFVLSPVTGAPAGIEYRPSPELSLLPHQGSDRTTQRHVPDQHGLLALYGISSQGKGGRRPWTGKRCSPLPATAPDAQRGILLVIDPLLDYRGRRHGLRIAAGDL